MGCKDKIRSTCGKTVNAKCVDYEGPLRADTTLNEECGCYDLEDVIEDINIGIDDINNEIDVSDITSDCITFETNEDGEIVIEEVVKKTVAKVCELSQSFEDEFVADCPPVFGKDITCLNLDMKCLADACGAPITNLKDLLQALIDQTCA